MDDSDSSSLSEHSDKEIQKLAPIFVKAKKATKLVAPPPPASPPRPKRSPSPPHEEVLADSPDIAFIVMFRSRFNEMMPAKLPNFGPQDIERGVVDIVPSPEVQHLLCALLGLVLNRKKPPERGHHGRALEEAVLSHKSQWPHSWNGQNPLHGGMNFENMVPAQRLNLLRTLVMWALSSSDAIQAHIKEKYKQNRHNDDENQPLSIQPWGVDGDKRRYFLVQGLDDTSFRVYREGSRYTKNAHWWSVAGSIEEVKELAKKLDEVDRSQAARRLASKITNAVPTFEATEEKRRRREYRQIRRAQFSRPEPGFSLYEGRTRGKRMRYTYDDDDSFLSDDDTSARRSTRQSGRTTPFDGPTFTASGRQVRAPKTGEYGEKLLSGMHNSADELLDGGNTSFVSHSGTEDSEQPVRGSRATRSGGRPIVNGTGSNGTRKHIAGYNDIDDMSDEADANSSGEEWDSDKNGDGDGDEEMVDADDEEDEASQGDDDEGDEEEEHSLVVKLKVPSNRPASSHTTVYHTTPFVAADCGSVEDTIPVVPRKLEPATDSIMESVTAAPPTTTDHAASSPLAPSAYPTPTSSSFMPPEQKPTLATALPPAAPAPAAAIGTTQPLFPVQEPLGKSIVTGGFTNGTSGTDV